ncbi:hypothetical protein [Parerythrobacter aestuarii]|uniref:hypothetical protein n=1 Tax=Parerythrobacter aestuarii TaxID=3020909 RepID=UPI0024DE5D59|nr:hypothetical protein [Parerythrobacter aestuarii]
MMRGLALLAAGLAGAASAQVRTVPFQDNRAITPVWVSEAPELESERVTIGNKDYTVLTKVRPQDALVTLDPTYRRKKRELLPASTVMVRAPGSDGVACEMSRKPGNERVTCLQDSDGDGSFDRLWRAPGIWNYFVIPIAGYQKKWEALPAPVRYRTADQPGDVVSIEMILRFYRVKDKSVLEVCLEPHRRKASWGFPHLVDECLKNARGFTDDAMPTSLVLDGFIVTALSFDAEEKSLTVRIDRAPGEREIQFGYRGD